MSQQRLFVAQDVRRFRMNGDKVCDTYDWHWVVKAGRLLSAQSGVLLAAIHDPNQITFLQTEPSFACGEAN